MLNDLLEGLTSWRRISLSPVCHANGGRAGVARVAGSGNSRGVRVGWIA
jgi:hypothetical protein